MTTKLSLYQGACALLGTRKLASLTENQLSRRELDGVFSRGGITTCLQMGQWNFAMRGIQLDYTPSIEPEFGYRRAFDKPTDWVRTCGLSSDEYFREPLLDVVDEAGHWFAELDTIYVRYVSNDTEYGMDYSLWPENFARVIEHYFAKETCIRLTQSQTRKTELDRDFDRCLLKAKSTDAMDEAASFPPEGSWTRARRGNNSRRDRGVRGRLIG
jgi:hypothetical protein